MAATLFEHIKAITETKDPKYWDKLDESDRKTWSNYMIIRFVTMNPDWVELIADILPYIQEAPPKAVYRVLCELLPKGKRYLKYMKSASSEKYEQWLVELVAKYYEVSISEAEDYLHILYKTSEGKGHIKKIAEAFGTDEKVIRKLKL